MDEALRTELLGRRDRDQAARLALSDTSTAEEWDVVNAIDADNTAWITTVVNTHGWPGRTMVGDEGASAAWLLVQHAPLDLQVIALPLLASAVAAGEAEFRDFAWLIDRVRMRRGLPQIFGSQFTRKNDTDPWEPYLMESAEADADAIRAAFGVDPIDATRRRLNGQS